MGFFQGAVLIDRKDLSPFCSVVCFPVIPPFSNRLTDALCRRSQKFAPNLLGALKRNMQAQYFRVFGGGAFWLIGRICTMFIASSVFWWYCRWGFLFRLTDALRRRPCVGSLPHAGRVPSILGDRIHEACASDVSKQQWRARRLLWLIGSSHFPPLFGIWQM